MPAATAPTHPARPTTHGQQCQGRWTLAWAQAQAPAAPSCEDCIGAKWLVSAWGGRDVLGLHVAVGDGIGGYATGAVASDAVVAHCLHTPLDIAQSADELWHHMVAADGEVSASVARHSTRFGAAAVGAAWLDGDGRGFVTRVGDVRVQLGGPASRDLSALFEDQMFGRTPSTVGTESARSDDVLARVVGGGMIGNPEIRPVRVDPCSLLIICSDGLHRWIDPDELRRCLRQKFMRPLEVELAGLVECARRRGCVDDISIVAVTCDGA